MEKEIIDDVIVSNLASAIALLELYNKDSEQLPKMREMIKAYREDYEEEVKTYRDLFEKDVRIEKG